MFYTKWDRTGKVEKKHRYTKKIQKKNVIHIKQYRIYMENMIKIIRNITFMNIFIPNSKYQNILNNLAKHSWRGTSYPLSVRLQQIE